jgi:DNA processing protein
LNEREMLKAWAGFVGIGEPHYTQALRQTDRGPPLLAITVNLFSRETPYIRFSQCRLNGAKFAAMCTLSRSAPCHAIGSGLARRHLHPLPPGELKRLAVMSGGMDQPSPLEKSHPPESI